MYMVGNQIGPCQVLKSPIFRSTPETPQGQADMEVDGDTPAKRVATGEPERWSGGTACQRQFLKGKLMLKQKRYGLFKENLGIGIKQGIFNGLVEGILYRKPRSFQSLPSNTRLFCRFSLQPGGWGTGVVPSAYLTPQKPWWGNWRVSLFLSLFHCLGYWTQKRFGGFGNWRVSSLVWTTI